MTSNLGSQFIQEEHDEEVIRDKVTELLKTAFRPEFLNRIDETVIFHRLSPREIKQIVGIQLRILQRRLGGRRLEIEVTEPPGSTWPAKASIRCTAPGPSSGRYSGWCRTRWPGASWRGSSKRAIASAWTLPEGRSPWSAWARPSHRRPWDPDRPPQPRSLGPRMAPSGPRVRRARRSRVVRGFALTRIGGLSNLPRVPPWCAFTGCSRPDSRRLQMVQIQGGATHPTDEYPPRREAHPARVSLSSHAAPHPSG